jgi:hypothetical protein
VTNVDVEDLRLAVYGGFRDTGRAPSIAELAVALGATAGEVRAGLDELARARHVVVGPDGEVVMAHPFSQVPMGLSVMGRDTLWWGGCCWDSFAVPHLLDAEPDVLVATRCPGCDRAGAWVVGRDAPPGGDWLAHFLVPVAHMWDDVVDTCRHQRIFCTETCVESWLARTAHDRGYVMDLAALWRLARGWYTGRLDPGYARREPAAAAAYFREVGLDGPFWGL